MTGPRFDVRAEERCPAELMGKRLAMGLYRKGAAGGLEKRCGACKRYLPADTHHFYSNRTEPDGLSGWCATCFRDFQRGRT